MSFRADIHVEWSRSPRIIVVEAPSVALSIQDLVDTARTLESSLDAVDDIDPLLNASGKEDLGSGTSVGITVQLINAKIAFAPRTTPASAGAATSSQTAGTLLTDSTATFLDDGVVEGDTVINFTDGSLATVIEVVSNTQIRHYALAAGSDNQWGTGDSYKVLHNLLCSVGGGNLTAIDALGASMPPISPTFGTQVTVAQATSATGSVARLDVVPLRHMIESQRASHPAFGTSYYWDPTNGRNTSDGLLPETAVKTWAAALALCSSGNGDMIYVITPAAGSVIVNENIVIDKEDVHLRGPGRGATIQPVAGTPITVAANNVSITGMIVAAPIGSTDADCIVLTGGYTKLEHLFLRGTDVGTGCGVRIRGGSHHHLHNLEIEHCALHGILVEDAKLPAGQVEDSLISHCDIYQNGGCGIMLTASPPESTEHVGIKDCTIHMNGEYGLHIGPGVDETKLYVANLIADNTLGAILDEGVDTHDERAVSLTGVAIWTTPVAGNEAAGTAGERLRRVKSDTALIPALV